MARPRERKLNSEHERERSEFDQRVLDIRRTARVVAGGRRFSFRAAVVVGNRKGRIGFGIGKGVDVSTAVEKAVQRFSYPCYVKPANMGSSVGITKVKSKETLQEAIDLAFQYDDKILIEQECKGREIECAILGHHKAVASLPGEVIPLKEFYDYKSKYIDDNASNLVVPAKLSKEEINLVIKHDEDAVDAVAIGVAFMERQSVKKE